MYVALFFSCCTVPTICSHRLKQILLVLQSPVYCYRRNRIQHSSINALLSTEQIPRAFYWISGPEGRLECRQAAIPQATMAGICKPVPSRASSGRPAGSHCSTQRSRKSHTELLNRWQEGRKEEHTAEKQRENLLPVYAHRKHHSVTESSICKYSAAWPMCEYKWPR